MLAEALELVVGLINLELIAKGAVKGFDKGSVGSKISFSVRDLSRDNSVRNKARGKGKIWVIDNDIVFRGDKVLD